MRIGWAQGHHNSHALRSRFSMGFFEYQIQLKVANSRRCLSSRLERRATSIYEWSLRVRIIDLGHSWHLQLTLSFHRAAKYTTWQFFIRYGFMVPLDFRLPVASTGRLVNIIVWSPGLKRIPYAILWIVSQHETTTVVPCPWFVMSAHVRIQEPCTMEV